MTERESDTQIARRAAEAAARDSYGRILAYLAARARNIAACEDALADAFRAALETWPLRGVPDRPEAWLLTAARRNLAHVWRHENVRAAAAPDLAVLAPEEAQDISAAPAIPDERLKLLFVCAHPAIEQSARTPLMLQTVLGLDAARIASAFLVSPAAMGQRLVRAKTKIRDAGIAFTIPEMDELPKRLEEVLAAIYAAYTCGWEDAIGTDPDRRGLATEAVWLTRVLVGSLPDEPEARGLLALMLHCEARRAARRDAAGAFVPLDRQDTALWDHSMIGEAEACLTAAARQGRLGRYQLEAAIQSVHAGRAKSGRVEWVALDALYDRLVGIAPSLGALVGHAVVRAKVVNAQAGLDLLAYADSETTATYQPFWVARARLLAEAGAREEAVAAYKKAIGLTEDSALRDHLVAAMHDIR
ncbi:MAG: RNA polymerase subunit sigma-70 [Tagaea sp. CACIAM 22H2]|nr:RNA polymerase subunit sigma-70 [Tagaea sp. CACIAM 22H2]